VARMGLGGRRARVQPGGRVGAELRVGARESLQLSRLERPSRGGACRDEQGP
jgi:hypothetical protein